MTRTKIPIIAIAIFSIAILLAHNNIEKAFAEVIYYEVLNRDTATSLSSFGSHNQFAGQFIDESTSILNGKQVNNLEVYLSLSGSPTGTITVGVWEQNSISGAPVYTFGTMLAQSLTTTVTLYNFTNFSNDVTLDNTDFVGVHFSGGGSTNIVRVWSMSGNPIDSDDSCMSNNDGGDLSALNCASGGFPNDLSGIISITSASDEGSDTACIDTNLDGTLDLCFVDTNNDGVADNGLGGSLGAFSSNSNVTQMGQTWFCSFNIGDACTNADAETNGVGVFYLGLMIVFSYAVIVSIHLMAIKASGNNVGGTQALMIHPILLLVMLFIDVGFAWYLNFIEDTIFYSVLVLMVGLGGFGIYRMVTKDN